MTAANPTNKPSSEAIRTIFDYDAVSGHLLWKSGCHTIKIGTKAGSFKPQPRSRLGHCYVGINRRQYYVHHIVWVWNYGTWPSQEIDHINQDGTDNRLENLRLATRSQNMANRPKPSHGKSPYKGVYFHKGNKLWNAVIACNKKRYCLGYFVSADIAKDAYNAKAKELFGSFAGLNR